MKYKATWDELKEWLPYSRRHLYRLEASGRFPKRIKIGPKRVAWCLDEIITWANEQLRRLKKYRHF